MDHADNYQISTVINRNAATSNTTVAGTPVAMSGYESVLGILCLSSGTTGGVVTMKAQMAATTVAGDFKDISGAVITVTHTAAVPKTNMAHKLLVINPPKGYVRFKVNPTVDPLLIGAVVAVRMHPRKAPVTLPTGQQSVTVTSPTT